MQVVLPPEPNLIIVSVGDELLYEKDPTIKVTVISNKKINFEGKEYSLSALTKKIRKLPYYVAPCKYWSYKGKNLDDIYNETYPLK